MRKFLSLFAVLVFCSVLAFAQTKVVKGKVTDAQGQPIPFSTIRIKGTKTGTAADADGNYTIRAKTGDVLVISGAGITSKEVTVTDAAEQDIQVVRGTAALTEVVVTALGVQRQAKELGYATTTLSNKTLTQAKSVGVAQALNGKVSGLNISTVNSGVFENAKINIRGIRSLTGNNQPMLVVDGAPTPLGYLSSIPPDDVQDLTILKSAASAAIYGPDAVNGVIIITTKRGGKRPTITVNSTVQATNVAFFPKLQKDFGQGAGETVDQYGNYGYVQYENQQFGPHFDGTIKPLGVPLEDGSIQMVPYSNGHYKDKIKFWNTGVTVQNSASIAGEDFYVSIEDARIKGLIPDDINQRTSVRFNGGKKYGGFSLNYGLNYILQNSDVVNEAGFQNSFPGAYDGGLFFLVMQTASNVPLLDYKDLNSKYGQFSNYYNEYAVNPYWLIHNIRSRQRQDDIIGSIEASYQFASWLKASARFSGNFTFSNLKNTNAPVIVSDWAKTVGFFGSPRNATQYSDRPGSVFDDEFFTSRLNLDYFLSGDHKFGNNLGIKYLLGGTMRQNRAKDVAVGGNNLVVPYLFNVSAKSGDANVPFYGGGTAGNNFDVESRLLSAYGTLGFSWNGWANAEFTGRNDWDSRLLSKNRSFFYPAANVSLVLSDVIEGLKNSSFISYLKLRGAISKSGNVNLNPYALQATYSQPAGFPYGNTVGYTANGIIPSPDLKPEFVNTKEVGVELGFMQNRINFNATYFFQKNTNQILQISQSSTTGYGFGLANAADFNNYGVEMDLNLTPLIRIGKARIDFRFNATYNNNEVTHTLGNVPVVVGGSNGFIQNSVSSPTINNIAVVGRPAFGFQMTDYLRDSATGKVIVDATTGMPTQAAGLVIRGRSLPLWVIGFTPIVTIGDFSFTMTWDYKGGHNFFSGLGSDEDFAGISARSAEYGRQRFVFPNSVVETAPGSGKYTANTNIQVQDGNSNFWTSAKANSAIATNYYASAAALRLREVNISYNIPAKVYGNVKAIKRITISAVGKNLLLFVPKSNQWGDPEFNYSTTGNTFGIASSFQSPAGRLLGGSLTVQF
ncbi:MAG: SusC/RagA family TonB-linked outer membrane protein [Bacteroidetes bacterium]|nr:SusC/RagA family TonB-linked outer membrane protein [Bacteroidota bacterium]